MCIIIDTNVLPSVFKQDSAKHSQFKPVRDWIIDGKGKVIFGGTKYLAEIKESYLSVFLQLKKAGKAIFVKNALVDAEQKKVANMIVHIDFDDPHLVALLRVSGCKLICSLDARAFPFFQSPIFFTPVANRPKIYKSLRNANLLCDKHIADVCKPCMQTTNLQKKIMGEI